MKVFYLEMAARTDLVASSIGGVVAVNPVEPPNGSVNQRFYRDVGTPWTWTDRAAWPLSQWQAYVGSDEIITVVLADAREGADGQELGYGELRNRAGDVEVVYYGLLPDFIGQGLGGAALVELLRFAWDLPQARRVWLHTCEADHPNALNNYLRRGFRHCRTEEESTE